MMESITPAHAGGQAKIIGPASFRERLAMLPGESRGLRELSPVDLS